VAEKQNIIEQSIFFVIFILKGCVMVKLFYCQMVETVRGQ